MNLLLEDLLPLIVHHITDEGTEPIHAHWESNNGSVLFFGGIHSFDPDHIQYHQIEETFNRFKPTVTLIEGAPTFSKLLSESDFEREKNIILSTPRNKLIHKAAEILFVAQLAFNKKSLLLSPEPDLVESFQYVRKLTGEAPEKLLLYLICCELAVWHRQSKDSRAALTVYLDQTFEFLRSELSNLGVISLPSLINLVNTTFSCKNFEEISESQIFEVTTPYGDHCFSKIGAEFSSYRDINLFTHIYHWLTREERIFVC